MKTDKRRKRMTINLKVGTQLVHTTVVTVSGPACIRTLILRENTLRIVHKLSPFEVIFEKITGISWKRHCHKRQWVDLVHFSSIKNYQTDIVLSN